jgi:hypothetical protein
MRRCLYALEIFDGTGHVAHFYDHTRYDMRNRENVTYRGLRNEGLISEDSGVISLRADGCECGKIHGLINVSKCE